MEKRFLVAVYGSLMEGLHNHRYLEDSKLKGSFLTEPSYTLVDLGSFPGLYEDGTTSISMEIYEVDEHTLADIDNLEGYVEHDEELSMYNRKTMSTPFGEAFGYIYNSPIGKKEPIISGDWREHLTFKTSLAHNVC